MFTRVRIILINCYLTAHGQLINEAFINYKKWAFQKKILVNQRLRLYQIAKLRCFTSFTEQQSTLQQMERFQIDRNDQVTLIFIYHWVD